MTEDGVKKCELAFLRLQEGNPNFDKHKDLPKNRVTAGIVSVEAGFDRGYLKKCCKKHLSLLSRIAAYRNSESAQEDSINVKYNRAKRKVKVLEQELEECKATMYKVLTQNLQLVETVRRLEHLIKP